MNRSGKTNALLVMVIGELSKLDFRKVGTACEALMKIYFEHPLRIVRNNAGGRTVYINTPNGKRLAGAVIDEIRHYLGDPDNKPVNTADEALIVEHCREWLLDLPDSDILNPQDYADYIVATADEELERLDLPEAEHNAIVEALLQWYDKQIQRATAQPDTQAEAPIYKNVAASGKTNIGGVSVELCCKRIRNNHKNADQYLNKLLEDSKGKVEKTAGGCVLINTRDEQILAEAIVGEVKIWFEGSGITKDSPELAAVIFESVDSWLEAVNSRLTAQPDQQPAATAQPDQRPADIIIDKDKLKTLFKPVFAADDYKERNTLKETKKLSRLDIFVENLNDLLSSGKCNKKRLAMVAYMIYKSKLAKTNRCGKFAEYCRVLFECCQLEAPKDKRTHNYSKPDADLKELFSAVLDNPHL